MDLSWRFDHRERDYINEVLDSGFASGTSGTMNTRLEEAFAKRMGKNFAITFNSGTTTLHASLLALGVGHGDEVIVSPLTVISCLNAIIYCNAVPVFADVDKDTFLIDPKDIKKKITHRTKAIMVVNLYGAVANMTDIMQIANEYGIKVLEDCAQCYLGTHNGRIGGTIGHVGSWSFENSKHLTTGDGGIVALDDEETADKIRKLSCQGFRNATAKSGKIRVSKEMFCDPSYKRHIVLGYMYRLPEICAAMGLAQLEKLDDFVSKRIRMADLYKSVISNMAPKWLVYQKDAGLDVNSYYTFAVKLENPEVKWKEFWKKYVAVGGDSFYAAWSLLYKEDSVWDCDRYLSDVGLGKTPSTFSTYCKNAEEIQPKLMQFTTNQKDESERMKQVEALANTIRYFT